MAYGSRSRQGQVPGHDILRQTGQQETSGFDQVPGFRSDLTELNWPLIVVVHEVRAALAGTLLRQLPWAVRSYEEMTEALQATRPSVVCLYAESSGWGRAAIAACRAAGVPTVAIQQPSVGAALDGPTPARSAAIGLGSARSA